MGKSKPFDDGYPKESRQHHFRGVWMPADVFAFVADGVITPTEAILLSIVDSFVNPKGDGCWASNATLGRMVAVSGKQVSKMVKHLKELGLVIDVGKKRVKGKDMRVIEAQWSRVVLKITVRPPSTPKCVLNTPTVRIKAGQVLDSSLRSESICRTSETDDSTGMKKTDNQGKENTTLDENGFFQSKEISKKDKSPPSAYQIHCAKKLRKALEKSPVFLTPFRLSGWAKEFRMLEKALDGDRGRLDGVLDWYVLNIKKPFVPEAYSAKSFRAKFQKISDARARDSEICTSVDISDDATKIFTSVSKLGWPKGTKAELLPAIQKSLDNYSYFAELMGGLKEQAKGYEQLKPKDRVASPEFRRLCKFALYLKVGNPVSVVEDWFRQVHSRISFDEWKGHNLKNWVWTHDHKMFQEQWRTKAAEYGYDAGFDKLMEHIYG
jgi:hypothetical protein